MPPSVKKTRSIKELLNTGGKRLSDLKQKSRERSLALEHVRAALPQPLARSIVSAGLDRGQLTIGVAGAAWAARLRYATDTLSARVSSSMGADIQKIRIRVVPPAPKT
jgi:hypothetical protein